MNIICTIIAIAIFILLLIKYSNSHKNLSYEDLLKTKEWSEKKAENIK